MSSDGLEIVVTQLALVKDATGMTELEDARFERDRLVGSFRKMDERREGLELAFQHRDKKPHPEASEEFKAKATAFIEDVRRSPRRAEIELDDLRIELAQMTPEVQAAKDRYAVLAQARTDEIAKSMVPRHRSATAAIANALEALSVAVAAEIELHSELASLVPEFPTSRHLPNLSSDWHQVVLNDPRSTGSRWVRLAQSVRLLDD